MVQFKVDHRLEGITVEGYEKLHFDEAFNQALCADVKFVRTLVKKEIESGILRTEALISPVQKIPGSVATLLGVERLEHQEWVEYEMGSHKGTWKIQPALFADTFIVGGEFEFHADGENAVRRIYSGNIEVRLAFVGGFVEIIIVAEVEKSYGAGLVFIQNYINGHVL